MDNNYLVSLYLSFKDDSRGWLALHRQHFTQFVAIISAILATSFGAFIQLNKGSGVPLVLVIGPFFGFVLSVFAILVCNKFYKRYAEHDAVGYKLFRILEDLQSDLRVRPKDETGKVLFPRDQHLFPKRWTSRLDKTESIDRYASGRVWDRRSSNFLIIMTFAILAALSLVLILAVLFGATV